MRTICTTDRHRMFNGLLTSSCVLPHGRDRLNGGRLKLGHRVGPCNT